MSNDASIPTKSETQRAGLTLETIGSTEIQPGQSVTLSTGLLLSSFEGRQARIINSIQGPRGDRDKIRVMFEYLTHADYGNEIKVVLVNFGCAPYLAQSGASIAQISFSGVDDVKCEDSAVQMKELGNITCLVGIISPLSTEPSMALAASTADADDDYAGHCANTVPTPYKKLWVGQQNAGGPEATGIYNPYFPLPEPCGVLQPIASRVLMEILYAATMCRYDCLRAVCGLVSRITKWTHQCDHDLRRAICYINATQNHKMIAWCVDSADSLDFEVYADADFAACVRTMRSTTGVTLAVDGPNAKMILNAVSKRRTVVSHSTPEAEIVVADYALRQEGMPTLTLFSTILGREVTLSML
jgi:dUTPase